MDKVKINKVNVLYSFDTKFWRLAAVSIESLLANSDPSTKIVVYCMVAPGTKGRRQIKKIVKSHESGIDLVWREITPCENPFQNYEYSKWSPVIFYRLIVHRIFKDVDKLLYLDSDTLIARDVAELFNTDISDYAVGAVRDMAQVENEKNDLGMAIKAFADKYLNGGPYYNSGVLLLNLPKIAEYENLLFETKVPLRLPDQDLLNAAFVGKIKTLPLKYNLAPGVGVPSHFSKEEKEDIDSGRHVIIHCYYIKPYDKEHSNPLVYDMFVKSVKSVGMKVKSFERADEKKTFIPHITIRKDKIFFLGLEIK